MAIKGPPIEVSMLINNKRAKAALKEMGYELRKFADSSDRAGRRISGTWWKRFGVVAVGFGVAYRAINLLETGMGRLFNTMYEGVKASGQLAEQQAKLAFWMTVFAKEAPSFANAFDMASGSMISLREEAVRSLSSMEELTTGIDELAQAGVPIRSTLIPQIVSLVDFTAMVAQTVGSTTRQIRQEFQALMDGTVRVNNQLVRVLKNMGVLTDKNLKDLRAMVNRAEIFDKVVGEIHTRWLKMVEMILRTHPEKAFMAWERAFQLMFLRSVELASRLEGVPNIFAEVFYVARKNLSVTTEQWERMVLMMQKLRNGLKHLVSAFESTAKGMASVVTVGHNILEIFSQTRIGRIVGWSIAIGAAATGIRILGGAMLWIAAKPATMMGRALMLALSPVILFPTAILAAVAALEVLAERMPELKEKLFPSVPSERTKDYVDHVKKIGKWFKGLYEKVIPDALEVSYRAWNDALDGVVDSLIELKYQQKIYDAWNKGRPEDERLQGYEDLQDAITEYLDALKKEEAAEKKYYQTMAAMELSEKLPRPATEEIKDFGVDVGKKFMENLKTMSGPLVDMVKQKFEELMNAGIDLDAVMEELGVDFKGLFKDLKDAADEKALARLAKQMDKFREQTAATQRVLDALRAGVVDPIYGPRELEYYRELVEISEHAKTIAAEVGILEAESWVKVRLALLDTITAEENFVDLQKMRYDLIDDTHKLNMTAEQYAVWALNEEIKKMDELIKSEEDLAILEEHRIARMEEIKAQYDDLADMFRSAIDSMQQDLADFFDNAMHGMFDLGKLIEGILDSWSRALADFMSKWIIDELLGKLLGSGGRGGGFLQSFAAALGVWQTGGGASPSIPTAGTPATSIPYFHRGTPIPSGWANLPMSMMDAAPRLHDGLKADEFPAILQKGESVYAKGEAPIDRVVIVNNTEHEPQVSEQRETGGGRRIQVMIGELAASDVSSGGPLHRSIRMMFGSKPQTVRR